MASSQQLHILYRQVGSITTTDMEERLVLLSLAVACWFRNRSEASRLVFSARELLDPAEINQTSRGSRHDIAQSGHSWMHQLHRSILNRISCLIGGGTKRAIYLGLCESLPLFARDNQFGDGCFLHISVSCQ